MSEWASLAQLAALFILLYLMRWWWRDGKYHLNWVYSFAGFAQWLAGAVIVLRLAMGLFEHVA